MKLSEYSGLDATALADLIRRKQVSPEEVLETSLEALEKINGKLNAVVDYTYEYALRQIKGGIDLSSPFPGVPMVLKDCGGEAAGIRATMGTRLSGKGVYAKEDSNFFKRLKQSGIIVVATAATSEFCIDSSTETLRNGPTHNPWNLEYSPGGSSGGSAALVAAGGVPIAMEMMAAAPYAYLLPCVVLWDSNRRGSGFLPVLMDGIPVVLSASSFRVRSGIRQQCWMLWKGLTADIMVRRLRMACRTQRQYGVNRVKSG